MGVDRHIRNVPYPRPRNCWTITLPSSGKVSFTEATTSSIDGMLKGVKSFLRSSNKLEVSVVIAASSAATRTRSGTSTGSLTGAGEVAATMLVVAITEYYIFISSGFLGGNKIDF